MGFGFWFVILLVVFFRSLSSLEVESLGFIDLISVAMFVVRG